MISKEKLILFFGLILGSIVGIYAVEPLLAQAIKILPDATLCICYDQPAATLSDVQTMKLEVSFDKVLSSTTSHICTANPITPTMFSCSFPLPTQYQTVGIHAVQFRTGNLEADDSISWGVLNTVNYEVTAKRGAPGTPVNIRIIKK